MSLLSLPAPVTRREKKEFTAKNGEKFVICLNVSAGEEIPLAINDTAAEFLLKYKTGGPDTGPNCPPVVLRSSLCKKIARLLVMQSLVTEDGDLWSFWDWACLAQRDFSTFSSVSDWAQTLSETVSNG